MTDNELLLTICTDIQAMKNNMQSMNTDIESMKEDLETVKRDVKHLRKEVIRMQAMDEAILDEVERVHGILDKHKEDKSVHTA